MRKEQVEIKCELRQQTEALETLAETLHEKESKLRDEEQLIASHGVKMHKLEKKLKIESQRLENWDKELKSSQEELSK